LSEADASIVNQAIKRWYRWYESNLQWIEKHTEGIDYPMYRHHNEKPGDDDDIAVKNPRFTGSV